MLQNILNLKGVQRITQYEQKLIRGNEVSCKEDGMCAQYGKKCAEIACKEVPLFEIDLI